MKVKHSPVGYSSIIKVGEKVNELETIKDSYLKLHRGVMDVDTIDINSLMSGFDYNQNSIQQYGPNDGNHNLIKSIQDFDKIV
jgi:hypothetical protein